jgi:predicted nucleotidyltransferase
MKDTKSALKWIINLLDMNKISYQIVGGLAAKTYGASRELADIDLYVSGKDFKKICNLAKDFITWGPKIWKSEEWDCEFVKILYNEQKIEIGNSDNTKRYDSEKHKWIKENINYEKYVLKKFLDIKIKVIPKDKLIEYKRKLNREVDIIDIQQIS